MAVGGRGSSARKENLAQLLHTLPSYTLLSLALSPELLTQGPEAWFLLSERCFTLFPRAHVQTHSAKVNHVNVQKIHFQIGWDSLVTIGINRASICREDGGVLRDSGKKEGGSQGQTLQSKVKQGASQPSLRIERVFHIYVFTQKTGNFEHLPKAPQAVSLHGAHEYSWVALCECSYLAPFLWSGWPGREFGQEGESLHFIMPFLGTLQQETFSLL